VSIKNKINNCLKEVGRLLAELSQLQSETDALSKEFYAMRRTLQDASGSMILTVPGEVLYQLAADLSWACYVLLSNRSVALKRLKRRTMKLDWPPYEDEEWPRHISSCCNVSRQLRLQSVLLVGFQGFRKECERLSQGVYKGKYWLMTCAYSSKK
jgi:hypothetical protein